MCSSSTWIWWCLSRRRHSRWGDAPWHTPAYGARTGGAGGSGGDYALPLDVAVLAELTDDQASIDLAGGPSATSAD